MEPEPERPCLLGAVDLIFGAFQSGKHVYQTEDKNHPPPLNWLIHISFCSLPGQHLGTEKSACLSIKHRSSHVVVSNALDLLIDNVEVATCGTQPTVRKNCSVHIVFTSMCIMLCHVNVAEVYNALRAVDGEGQCGPLR